MMVLVHFDWAGTQEELEKYTAAVKKAYDSTPGTKFLGRLIPWNKKYHYTHFMEVKDLPTMQEAGRKVDYKRDYKVMTHGEYDIFS